MTSTTDFGATSDTATVEAERYLKEVAPYLAALQAEERADLLDDLAQHLREIAAEPGPPLSERLGSPEAYAAELLVSAGVAAAGRSHPALLSRATAFIARARATWIGQEVVSTWPFLRPAWWVLRGYLAVSLLAGGQAFPVPRLAGNPFLGILGVLAAIPLSVRLGQRTLPRTGRLAVFAGNAVLVLYGLSLLARAESPDVRYVDYGPGPVETAASRGCLTTATGQRTTNLYAYDAEGRLLDPVLLYDQDGQPIDNLCPEFDERGRRLVTEYRQDVNGAPVINAFPRRQTAFVEPEPPFRPGSASQPEATVPVKPPAVVVPRLAPPTTATTITTTPPPGR